MSGRPREAVRRRKQYGERIDELVALAADAQGFAAGSWSGAAWKHRVLFEMLAVRAFTEWESFAHELLILELARDTSALASATGLTIPKKTTFDLAEALLTSRKYLEFRDTAELRGQARKWLVNSPFSALSKSQCAAADDLRTIRNFVVHRSRQGEQAYRSLLRARAAPALMPGEFLAAGSPTRLDGYLTTLAAMGGALVP